MNTDTYQTKLAAEKMKLTAELSSFAVMTKDNPGNWEAVREEDKSGAISSDEVAEELENMNERKAAEEPLEKQLKKVDLALKKIADGNFGLCEIDGEPIEEDRLEANPTARTCKKHMDDEEGLSL